MYNLLFKKSLVVGIIILFVGAIIIPNIRGNITDDSKTSSEASADYDNLMEQIFDAGDGRTDWVELQKLLASDGVTEDSFGFSVSISGDYAIIGAWAKDYSIHHNSGSAYIFMRSGTTWAEKQKLHASDPATGDHFGESVSIDGDYAIIGARYDDNKNGDDAGSAYIFKRSGTTWTEQVKLTASDGTGSDHFGSSVSIDGDYAIIGARYDDNKNGDDAGSAYVFKRSGTTWAEEAKLLASDGAAGDQFGISVSIDGDYALIGAYRNDDNGDNSGSAYVFKRSGTTWAEEAQLIASDAADSDYFGFSVSIDGDYALIGAFLDDDNGDNSGSAYVFIKNNPPNTPSNPNPPDGTTGVNVNAILNWTCNDPDGDPLTYDVYFEADDLYPDELVSDDQTENTYDPGTLQTGTTYYWQIIAKDELGASTPGPIWRFTTKEAQNEPPSVPTIDGQISGKSGTSYDYTFTSSDPDGDNVSYYINWGDGSTTDWTTYQTSGTSYTENHTWTRQGIYTIKAKTKDTNGLESNWATLTIIMPRNKIVYGPFLNYIQTHPNLFPMLRLLLQRLGLQ